MTIVYNNNTLKERKLLQRGNQNVLNLDLLVEVMVKAQCSWDVARKMNSSIDSTNVLVANLKALQVSC